LRTPESPEKKLVVDPPNGRAFLNYRATRVARQAVALTQPGAAQTPTVNLRYLAASPIRVHGPITRRAYDFSARQALQPVDVRDAAALLRMRFFTVG
jgi:hypothetical protein